VFAVRAPADLLAVRFAWSPAWETMGAVRTLVDERARPYHTAWHRAVADRVARLDLDPLFAVHPVRGYVPDFMSPPPDRANPRLADQLAQIRSTPATRVAHELVLCRRTVRDPRYQRLLDGFVGDPAAARDLLAARLQEAWSELVAPFWTRIRGLLDRDIAERSRILASQGLRRVLADIHPRIRWTAEGISVADGYRTRVALDERGLVLLPSAYLWPAVAAVVDEPWLPTIAYPARGIGELWNSPAAPPHALGRLIGRTRALILAALEHPQGTSTLAGRLGLSPAGVSAHLIAMRDAGLVIATRRRHEVLYRRTPLGSSLLRGGLPPVRRDTAVTEQ
jgi:DNA-binding transcriptional ArsR family regulator